MDVLWREINELSYLEVFRNDIEEDNADLSPGSKNSLPMDETVLIRFDKIHEFERKF